MEELRSTGGGPAPAPTPGKPEPKMVDVAKLPQSIAGMLSWLTEQDARNVRAGIFHSPLTRDIFEAARFVDATLLNSKRAEDWVGRDRITGVERDQYREKIEQALGAVVRETMALARRARLTEILQRNRILVQRYGGAVGAAARKEPPAADADAA